VSIHASNIVDAEGELERSSVSLLRFFNTYIIHIKL